MLDQKTKNMRLIGMIMFFAGAIIAISAAAKVPAADADYPNTTAIFTVALMIAILGNILWHKTEKASVLAQLEMHKNDEANNPIVLLEKTIPALEHVFEQVDRVKGMELCDRVDEVLDNYIHPFTEKRKTFMDILGQAHGAEVLLMIAYAERMLNRVWSASSDGHHEEAVNCLQDSLQNYKQALRKTKEYQS